MEGNLYVYLLWPFKNHIGSRVPADFNVTVFTCACFWKIAWISSLCDFYYSKLRNSFTSFWVLMALWMQIWFMWSFPRLKKASGVLVRIKNPSLDYRNSFCFESLKVSFLQKMNENKSHSSKIEFVHSFEETSSWRNHFYFVWPLAIWMSDWRRRTTEGTGVWRWHMWQLDAERQN